jgi:hypothetical protein
MPRYSGTASILVPVRDVPGCWTSMGVVTWVAAADERLDLHEVQPLELAPARAVYAAAVTLSHDHVLARVPR